MAFRAIPEKQARIGWHQLLAVVSALRACEHRTQLNNPAPAFPGFAGRFLDFVFQLVDWLVGDLVCNAD